MICGRGVLVWVHPFDRLITITHPWNMWKFSSRCHARTLSITSLWIYIREREMERQTLPSLSPSHDENIVFHSSHHKKPVKEGKRATLCICLKAFACAVVPFYFYDKWKHSNALSSEEGTWQVSKLLVPSGMSRPNTGLPPTAIFTLPLPLPISLW